MYKCKRVLRDVLLMLKGMWNQRLQDIVTAIRILIDIGVITKIVDSHLGHQLKLLLQLSEEELRVRLIV